MDVGRRLQVCALKEYNVTDPSNIKKLQNELKILSSLDHPCILQVLPDV